MNDPAHIKALLAWYLDAGVDETIAAEPNDRRGSAAAAATAAPAAVIVPQAAPPASAAVPPRNVPSSAPAPSSRAPSSPLPAAQPQPAALPAATAENVQTAARAAAAAKTLADLRAVLADFDGCALKRTATNLVFADGAADARVVFIGEAPGADEDRAGVPFVGASGRLLDQILASIGLSRETVLISNTVFWRPPGNRTPATAEAAVCLPFVERLIEIVDPQILVMLGGAAAKSLLGRPESVGRLRGRWLSFTTPRLARPLPATVTFHPAYLLRTPAQKRAVWHDFLGIRKKLENA